MTDRAPLPADGKCVACRDELHLVEGGYTNTWLLNPSPFGEWAAFDRGITGFSLEGSGEMWTECPNCLAEYEPPSEVVYE